VTALCARSVKEKMSRFATGEADIEHAVRVCHRCRVRVINSLLTRRAQNKHARAEVPKMSIKDKLAAFTNSDGAALTHSHSASGGRHALFAAGDADVIVDSAAKASVRTRLDDV
jgi:hypothetical protein